MHCNKKDSPLTEHLLEQFAGWYLISVLAVRAMEHARSLHANRKEVSRTRYQPKAKPSMS